MIVLIPKFLFIPFIDSHLVHRENGHNSGTVSKQGFSTAAGSSVCSTGAALHRHDLLLLHAQVAYTTKTPLVTLIATLTRGYTVGAHVSIYI